MCGENHDCGCCHPEVRKQYPDGCTPEQIEDCHEDSENHPCDDDDK